VPPQKIIASYLVKTDKQVAHILCGKLYHKYHTMNTLL